ncbi:MAG: antibiotic biosynthesis monooxygenase [Opitutus sp.]
MITRIWRGWTTLANAAIYEALFTDEVFVDIARAKFIGYLGISLIKRTQEADVEFATIMWFSDLDAVRKFGGEEYQAAVVPPKARALLCRFEAHATHYETLLAPPGVAR